MSYIEDSERPVSVVADQNKKAGPASAPDFFGAGTQVATPVSRKDTIRYEGVVNIDYDIDLAFKLRGINFNPLVDVANPLVSMVLSVKKLSDLEVVEELYHRVRDEITAIFEEIKSLGYDTRTQRFFRYGLCSFIDETIMGTPWGKESIWTNQSMLAHFENDVWGGEKFFAIISHAEVEPDKYKDLLEFFYLCLSLGFKGQYFSDTNGNEKIQELLIKLNFILREQRGEVPETLLNRVDVKKVGYKFRHSFPLWGIWLVAFVILVAAFTFYSISLDSYSDKILTNINEILDKWSVN